jgi:hypothetical protein
LSNQERRNLFVWKEILGEVWFFSATYPFCKTMQKLFRLILAFKQEVLVLALVGFQGECYVLLKENMFVNL